MVVADLTTPVGGSTSVTLDRPGKVLVQLHGSFTVACGAVQCDRTVGVKVGEESVPGAFATIDSAALGSASRTVSAAGILTDVPAGTHAVSIVGKTTGSPITTTDGGDARVVAIVPGG